MTIDPQLMAALEPPRPEDGTYYGLDVATARATLDRMVQSIQTSLPPVDGIQRTDILADEIPVRLYRPNAGDKAEQLPLVILVHGGGWVLGNIESHDRMCAQLSRSVGCCVASAEYRLAPEAKFPAGLDDTLAVFRHMSKHAETHGIDRTRIAISGDSAGGALAAAAMILLRDGGEALPVFQLLLYPSTDLAGSHASRTEFAGGPMVSGKELEWYIDCYLPDRALLPDFRVSPLRASSLVGLAPTIVVTAGNDMLRDEGLAYSAALIRAGNRVTHMHYPTMVHGFLLLTDFSNEASKALDEIAAAVRIAFS